MELLFKESMSQKRKLQFLQPRGSEAKKVNLSRLRLHGYLRLACMKRGMGPTAKATEIMEPAIQLICDREMTHFELENSAKAASLAENLLLRNLKRKTHSADRKPEPLAYLYWDPLGFLLTNKETGRISPLRSIKAAGRLKSSEMTTKCVIEINKRLQNHRKPVKQNKRLTRPKTKIEKAKYQSTPLKGQEKPRYFW